MNIFILDDDIETNVKYYVDSHIIKMQLEHIQMLSTTIRHYSRKEYSAFAFLTKSTHFNHPCSIWTRTNPNNFKYLWELTKSIATEHQYRYQHNKEHKSVKNFKLFLNNISSDFLDEMYSKFPNQEQNITNFATAMDDEYKLNDPVSSYRNYYNKAKRHLFKWKNRPIPYWIENYV